MMIQEIIAAWLGSKVLYDGGFRLYSHMLETDLPIWAAQNLRVMHTPSSYARIFRLMREQDSDLLDPFDVQVLETQERHREKAWLIQRRSSMRSPSQSTEGTLSYQPGISDEQ